MPLDAVLGCGDLEPGYLCFLADAFRVPLLHVRGNHDRGESWEAGGRDLPTPIDGRIERVAGLTIAGLSWPSHRRDRATRDGAAAWGQTRSLMMRSILGRGPSIVISHVPPFGLGDSPEDDYHRGFDAYRWLCRVARPALWLHGHTTPAAAEGWRLNWNGTTVVNVTGAVVIDVGGGPARGGTIAPPPGTSPEAGSQRAEEP